MIKTKGICIVASLIMAITGMLSGCSNSSSSGTTSEESISTQGVCEDVVWGTQYIYFDRCIAVDTDLNSSQSFLMQYAYKGAQPEISYVGMSGTNIDCITNCSILMEEFDYSKTIDVQGYKSGGAGVRFEVIASEEKKITIDSIILNIDGKETEIPFVNPLKIECIDTTDNFAHPSPAFVAMAGCDENGFYEINIRTDRDAVVTDFRLSENLVIGDVYTRDDSADDFSQYVKAGSGEGIKIYASDEAQKIYMDVSQTVKNYDLTRTTCSFSALVTDKDGNQNRIFYPYFVGGSSLERDTAYVEAILKDAGKYNED